MRFLTNSECVTWCTSRGYPAGNVPGYTVPKAARQPEGFSFAEFKPPTDSGQKVWFSRFLFGLIDPTPEVLLWLGNWGVWGSSEHMPLFTRFRQAFGEVRPLIEVPGHLASAEDADDAISILATALLFVWDCHVITSSGRDVIYLSHDEYSWFASRDPSTTQSMEQRIGDALK